MDIVHCPYILYTPRSRCRYPIGTTSPQTQEVVPFPPGVKTGRLPQHLNLVQASLGSCLNLSDPDLSPQRLPSSSREGATYRLTDMLLLRISLMGHFTKISQHRQSQQNMSQHCKPRK
ncbi:hypothetical protein CHARACLAT_009725 [Characodon lateralis]|uniref:Uncharacterized protein n=1 Tax=Characodon lateralis TaxID=208331 RepID=A0ABU7F1L5_9TELE|nr:hypothetical protein [Characodon lateralis]